MDYIKNLRSKIGNEKVIMVVAGAYIFDKKNRILLQQRTDSEEWGLPGGFMEMGENVQDTARREVMEETGIEMGHLELFGIYSGPNYDKTFANGDQVSMVQILFICRDFKGSIIKQTEESITNGFFSLDKLPARLFSDHRIFFQDFLANPQLPVLK